MKNFTIPLFIFAGLYLAYRYLQSMTPAAQQASKEAVQAVINQQRVANTIAATPVVTTIANRPFTNVVVKPWDGPWAVLNDFIVSPTIPGETSSGDSISSHSNTQIGLTSFNDGLGNTYFLN